VRAPVLVRDDRDAPPCAQLRDHLLVPERADAPADVLERLRARDRAVREEGVSRVVPGEVLGPLVDRVRAHVNLRGPTCQRVTRRGAVHGALAGRSRRGRSGRRGGWAGARGAARACSTAAAPCCERQGAGRARSTEVRQSRTFSSPYRSSASCMVRPTCSVQHPSTRHGCCGAWAYCPTARILTATASSRRASRKQSHPRCDP
jgi:hypothetical protein